MTCLETDRIYLLKVKILTCTMLATTGAAAASYRALAQKPSQSMMHQQIQPTNQPQNLMKSQNQMNNQLQNPGGNQSNLQVQGQNQSATQNQIQSQNQNPIPSQLPQNPGTGQASNTSTNTFSPPILHGLDQNNSASMTEAGGQAQANLQFSPVEAFFQTAPSNPHQAPPAKHHGGAYKFLWHTLDDIGVPMFGNHDPDIDPALSKPFVMPPQNLNMSSAKDAPGANQAHQNKAQIIDPQATAQDPALIAPDDTPPAPQANSNPHQTSNPQ